ncbi:LOW QUALITY PROTEIN: trimethylguanosine synthase-like [Pollicipes pollicipes]|uniref:LOW QUALITY PROTEIN: trimethylguanosine synthase-like n=1 Tax=Pollicipes pollicipes TaxID=41117 RepID=UPI0018850D43|nr:LOW QUALITY PROTEIN: trimethylguanosine synthase-like [Pollicipes pollicipes]
MPSSTGEITQKTECLPAIVKRARNGRKNLPSWKTRQLKEHGVGAFLQQLLGVGGTSEEQSPSTPLSLTSSNKPAPNKDQVHGKPSASGEGDGPEAVNVPYPQTLVPVASLPDHPSEGRRGGVRKRKASSISIPAEIRQSPELRKYWHQRYRLFSRFDEGVQLDRDGWFSVTPEHIARHLADRCRADVIVDAFCGVGGNAIQFAATCRLVIAVDICPERVRLARHNAAVYGVQHNIQFVVGDFFRLAPRLHADAVFLSPPWGGPEYSGAAVYDMFRLDGSMDGRRMMRAARRISPNVALLAPRTANLDQLAALAGPGGRVEVEQNLLNGRAKTITAYYGGLVRPAPAT